MSDMNDGRKTSLNVEIINGCINISIGIDTLAFAITHSPDQRLINTYAQPENDDFYGLNIIDNDEFSKEFINQILEEDEDGTNSLHRFIEEQVNEGLNYGRFLSVDLDNPKLQTWGYPSPASTGE